MSELEFKPITEGLGFHPFADGLPYAPVSKTAASQKPADPAVRQTTAPAAQPMGTGAVAAGVARPVRFPQPATGPTKPMGTGAVAAGPAIPVRSQPTVRAKPAPQVAAPTQARTPSVEVTETFGFGYLMERIAAFTLDTALILSGLAAGTSFYLSTYAVPSGREMNSQDLAYILLVVGSLHWALMTFQEVAFGTTIGKRIFGLRIPGSAAAVFLRSFFFVPSLLFGGLGLLTAVFDKRRRCLHDLIADVQPSRWT
jgi:uncharacterized RDD family membrane protein YckC